MILQRLFLFVGIGAKTRYSYANLRYQKDGINWIGGEAIDRWSDYVEWNPQSSYSNLQKGVYGSLMPFAACRLG